MHVLQKLKKGTKKRYQHTPTYVNSCMCSYDAPDIITQKKIRRIHALAKLNKVTFTCVHIFFMSMPSFQFHPHSKRFSYSAHGILYLKKNGSPHAQARGKSVWQNLVLWEALLSFSEQHLRTWLFLNLRNFRRCCLCSYTSPEIRGKELRVHMHKLAHLQSRAFWPRPGCWGPTRYNTFGLLEPPNGSSDILLNFVFENNIFNPTSTHSQTLGISTFLSKKAKLVRGVTEVQT